MVVLHRTKARRQVFAMELSRSLQMFHQGYTHVLNRGGVRGVTSPADAILPQA